MHASPLLPLHRAAGARLGPAEAGAPLLTFGDVPGEYAAAREAAALFDACARGCVAVTGADAEAFLHRITSNTVRGLAPGEGCRDLLLSAKGKVLFDFDLVREADGFRLSTPPGAAARLIETLDMYLFTEDVTLADCTEQHAPLEVCGPRAGEALGAVLGAGLPTTAGHCATYAPSFGAVTATALDVAGTPGFRVDAGPGGVEALWRALVQAGARPAGLVARDSLRAEACRAEWGRDVDDTIYPQEARLEDAFALDKGCYIGQEVVAKIDTYGGLNKRLLPLAVDHEDPVPAGTRLMLEQDGEWRDLGVVTTWAWSFALDGGIVLAYVKRKHQETGTSFRLGDGPGTARIVDVPVRRD